MQSWWSSSTIKFFPFFDFVFVIIKGMMFVARNVQSFRGSMNASTQLCDTIASLFWCQKWLNIRSNELRYRMKVLTKTKKSHKARRPYSKWRHRWGSNFRVYYWQGVYCAPMETVLMGQQTKVLSPTRQMISTEENLHMLKWLKC